MGGLFDRSTVSFDCETTGLDPHKGARPFLWTLCGNDGEVLTAYTDNKKAMRKAKDWLADPSLDKVAHNAKFDLRMALWSDVKVTGRVHDTMIMATLVNEYEKSHSLKALARKYLGVPAASETVLVDWFRANITQLKKRFGKTDWKRYDAVPREILQPYAEDDARLALRLFYLLSGPIEQSYAAIYIQEMKFLPCLLEIEERGHAVDWEYFNLIALKTKRKLAKLDSKFSFNPASPMQIGKYFAERGIQSVVKTPKGGESWGKDALASINHPMAKHLVNYREMSKLLGTYYEPLSLKAQANPIDEEDAIGEIFPTFWQTGSKAGRSVVTGRLSSSDPNFQNIPRRDKSVRRGFVPRPGYGIYYFDYKQIEMVIFACSAGDRRLMQAVQDGVDLHARTAELLFGKGYTNASQQVKDELRQVAKTINFGIIYGMGAKKLAKSLREQLLGVSPQARLAAGISTSTFSVEDARPILARYHKALPTVGRFMKETMWKIGSAGFVQDIFGRRYHVPADLRYKGVNALIQGCAASVMKRGVIKLTEALGDDPSSGIVNLVHDEIQLEVKLGPNQDVIARRALACLEDRTTFPVPLLLDVAYTETSWADKAKRTL